MSVVCVRVCVLVVLCLALASANRAATIAPETVGGGETSNSSASYNARLTISPESSDHAAPVAMSSDSWSLAFPSSVGQTPAEGAHATLPSSPYTSIPGVLPARMPALAQDTTPKAASSRASLPAHSVRAELLELIAENVFEIALGVLVVVGSAWLYLKDPRAKIDSTSRA